MKVDWETFWWVSFSLAALVAVVTFFWVFRLPDGDILPHEGERGGVPAPLGEIEINLEEAQVSKLSGTGKEWEFSTRNLRKREEQLELDEVSGFLFRDQMPFYQVEAEWGWIDLDTQDVRLETVYLSDQDDGNTITGETFEWMGDQKLFYIKSFTFESSRTWIEADQARYDTATGKINLIDNVEIRMKAGY